LTLEKTGSLSFQIRFVVFLTARLHLVCLYSLLISQQIISTKPLTFFLNRNFSTMQLQDIPSCFRGYPRLKSLILDGNKFNSVPEFKTNCGLELLFAFFFLSILIHLFFLKSSLFLLLLFFDRSMNDNKLTRLDHIDKCPSLLSLFASTTVFKNDHHLQSFHFFLLFLWADPWQKIASKIFLV